jgi:uncharacterized ferritin-like protein (DUF455 family)
MTVIYPRKTPYGMRAQDILKQVVSNSELHLITLNRYRYNEQHSCKDLTDLIEKLNGQPREIVRDLSHHIADEARHAQWLTDLLYELGADIGTPPGVSYIGEFERLLDQEAFDSEEKREEGLIAALASINVTEKRGCEYFAAHLKALAEAPQTEENTKIQATIAKIFPEEAGHVRWGNRWLAQIARKSDHHRQRVEIAKHKYAAIEQAAYNAGMDIMAGAELRRLNNLVEIANTLPLWERPQYVLKHLPQTLLAPDLQLTRLRVARQAWERNPQDFLEKFVPLFLRGINDSNLSKPAS